MTYKLQYKRYSENAILIEWPSKIDENILQDLLLFKKCIEIHSVKEIVEVISGYNSLLIFYTIAIEDIYNEVLALKSIYSMDFENVSTKSKLWEIPVCYTPDLAPDLVLFAQKKSLTIDQVISLHTSPIYRVYFLGFLPGFFYLGGLDGALSLPRKTTPSLHVKKGSVAIGGNQTGIYPVDSPGGWYVIGKCPIDFFNPNWEVPCFISANDRIKFISITDYEYNDISSRVKNQNYTLKPVSL